MMEKHFPHQAVSWQDPSVADRIYLPEEAEPFEQIKWYGDFDQTPCAVKCVFMTAHFGLVA